MIKGRRSGCEIDDRVDARSGWNWKPMAIVTPRRLSSIRINYVSRSTACVTEPWFVLASRVIFSGHAGRLAELKSGRGPVKAR